MPTSAVFGGISEGEFEALNTFVMNVLRKCMPLNQILRGSAIFHVPRVAGLVPVPLVPGLAPWLPGFMRRAAGVLATKARRVAHAPDATPSDGRRQASAR